MPRYYSYREINALNEQGSHKLYEYWRPEHARWGLINRMPGHLRGKTRAPGSPDDLLWLCGEWNEAGHLVRKSWLLYDGIKQVWSFLEVRQLLPLDRLSLIS